MCAAFDSTLKNFRENITLNDMIQCNEAFYFVITFFGWFMVCNILTNSIQLTAPNTAAAPFGQCNTDVMTVGTGCTSQVQVSTVQLIKD